ncbi:MAG TPA: prolipoprotein diacylglyceryl transferase [Firmicutes bacterium]|nr:prolipoprotein diacylglyceryl transferase [Bacillota bacterium]
MNVLFFFADFPVYAYGFMLGLGLLLGTVFAQREGKRKEFGADFIFRFIVQSAAVFVIAGRAAFVYTLYGWRLLIYPWVLFTGAQLDEATGAIAAGLYVLYFILRYVDRPAEFLDIFAPVAAFIQALACLGSSVLGRETNVVWGIGWGEFSLHPVPLYGALIYYFIFSCLWRARRNLRYNGQLFLGYLALSAGAQRILLPFQEVYGESPNPWLYTLAFLLFGAAWFYVYISSPFTDVRRRRRDWRSRLFYLASILGTYLAMIKFFYWRFY